MTRLSRLPLVSRTLGLVESQSVPGGVLMGLCVLNGLVTAVLWSGEIAVWCTDQRCSGTPLQLQAC